MVKCQNSNLEYVIENLISILFDQKIKEETKTENKQVQRKNIRKKMKKINNVYQCKYCDYNTYCTNNLSMHCRKHHSEKLEWKNLNKVVYDCEHCNEKFNYKMNLIEHIHKKHKKIKKKCPFCEKMISMNGVYAHCYKKHATSIQKKENNLSEYKYGKMLYERKLTFNNQKIEFECEI